jgi:uncharacterized protein YjbI with pentapeptide repeats
MRGLVRALMMFALVGSLAAAAGAADISTRDVTAILFKASRAAPPDLSGKNLSRLDLADLDFKAANLANADLFGADLTRADLVKSDLHGARLDRATITAARFDGADMTGVSLLSPNMFSTLEVMRHEIASFTGANMAGAEIIGRFDFVSFRAADLNGTVFGSRDQRSPSKRVTMVACDFQYADLRNADLRWSVAKYAKFQDADVRGANFAHSNLMAANFSRANVAGADFTGAVLDGAKFEGAQGLDAAKGLTSAILGTR